MLGSTVVTLAVCLFFLSVAAGQESKTKKLCQKLGFTAPFSRAEIDQCSIECISRDDTLTEHFERSSKCEVRVKKRWVPGVCKYGECFNPNNVQVDLSEYVPLEISLRKYASKEGNKLDKRIGVIVSLVNPKGSKTYKNGLICEANARNKAGVTSVDYKLVCKTRLINKKAKLIFDILDSWEHEIDTAEVSIGEKLDKGDIEVEMEKGTLTVDIKTGKKGSPPQEEPGTPSDKPKLTTGKPKGTTGKPKPSTGKPKRTTTSTKKPKPEEEEEEEGGEEGDE